MADWTETHRGTVPPWQCDVTEHFTIGYYFDRLEEAEANLADELCLSDLSGRSDLPRRLDVRFARELRAGSSFHVESAALDRDTSGDDIRRGLRLGHRFVDSANGEVVTWIDEYLTAWVGERFVLNLRVAFFSHLQRLSLGYFERHQLGDIMSRLGGDVAEIETLVLTGVNMALTYAFQIVLFTDQWLSPIARFARHVIAGRTAVPSAWDSSAALFVVVETLIGAVTRQLEADGAKRIRELENLR